VVETRTTIATTIPTTNYPTTVLVPWQHDHPLDTTRNPGIAVPIEKETAIIAAAVDVTENLLPNDDEVADAVPVPVSSRIEIDAAVANAVANGTNRTIALTVPATTMIPTTTAAADEAVDGIAARVPLTRTTADVDPHDPLVAASGARNDTIITTTIARPVPAAVLPSARGLPASDTSAIIARTRIAIAS